MLKKRIFYFCLLFIAAVPVFAAPSRKPHPPVSVSISPSQKAITPESIQPGDEIELNIVTRSVMDADLLKVQIHLTEGVNLLSGDSHWSGPVQKNQEIILRLTVKAPVKGTGTVIARATLPGPQGSSFSTEAEYQLGVDKTKKKLEKLIIKKDRKGRRIREYR